MRMLIFWKMSRSSTREERIAISLYMTKDKNMCGSVVLTGDR